MTKLPLAGGCRCGALRYEVRAAPPMVYNCHCEPVGDIWTRSAQPWVRFVEGGIPSERQPADYLAFVERFRAQGRFPQG